MSPAEPNSRKFLPTWLSRPLGWLAATAGFLFRFLLVAWAAMVIYWSNLPWYEARVALAVAFVAFSIWSLWITRRPRMHLAFASVFLVVVVWSMLIPASHDRDWPPEVAVMARATIDGDRVRISGFRNFEYRSRNDFTVKWEEREVQFSHLTGVDFYISYWMPGPVGHTFVSFIFDNAPPVSISIETRPEVGESYAPLASMFKQFELIYVVGDERDLVGVRTNHRNEDVFLYRLQISRENARRLFAIYLLRINELADRAEWYHLLSNSCTINIVRYANRAGREGGFSIRHLLNGLIDGYLYAVGFLDTSLPFDELRRRSLINAAAQAAEGDPEFSRRIREGLPAMQAAPAAR